MAKKTEYCFTATPPKWKEGVPKTASTKRKAEAKRQRLIKLGWTCSEVKPHTVWDGSL